MRLRNLVSEAGLLIGLMSLMLGCAVAWSAQDGVTPEQQLQVAALDQVIQPDPVVQARLRDLIPDGASSSTMTEDQFRGHMRELRAVAGPAFDRLIPQLVYFSVHSQVMGSRGDVAEAMLPAVIIDKLEIGAPLVAAALAPYIDTGNARVDHEVREFIGGVDNFLPVLQLRVRNGEKLPRSLICYLFESDPGRAVLMIQEAVGRADPDQWRPVLWAEHQVADVLWKWRYGFLPSNQVEPAALEAISRLALHEQWWARLYAAEVLRQYAPFRSAALIELLRNDADESVRAVVETMPVARAADKGAQKSPSR